MASVTAAQPFLSFALLHTFPLPCASLSCPASPPLRRLPFLTAAAPKRRRSQQPKRRRRSRGGGDESGGSAAAGAADLEAEIFEFMRRSAKPAVFPTKQELIAGGRADLADAIESQGGWLALGWGLGGGAAPAEPKDATGAKFSNGALKSLSDSGDSLIENASVKHDDEVSHSLHASYTSEQSRSLGTMDGDMEAVDSIRRDCSLVASSAGTSLDFSALSVNGGIEAILSGLENERRWPRGIGTNVGISANKSDNGSYQNINSDNWRARNKNLLDFCDFRAAEITPTYSRMLCDVEGPDDKDKISRSTVVNQSRRDESLRQINELGGQQNELHLRLQNLESSLTSSLNSLRSKSVADTSQKADELSPSKLDELNDEWEFQETKLMHAKNELRSIRAKLSVLRGKKALETSVKGKMIEDKQRRIDAAEKALSLLRTVYILWPHSSASEVMLAGSFDGWSSRKSMTRSTGQVFWLTLRLYPGRYEIKFIVDGVWKVDPLRPIVDSGGHQNNLLVVS